MRFFVDTNVIVYTRDRSAPRKRERAIAWLLALASADAITISPQVLNESINAFINKLDLDHDDLMPFVRGVASWCTAPVGPEVTAEALRVRSRWKFGWWDCLIVASAAIGGCDHVLTEDLQDGQKLDTLEVVDPFGHEPSVFLFLA